jgi:hypothetical protein
VTRTLNSSLGLFIAVIMLGKEAWSQASLDAPSGQEGSTLRSEIKRGSDAARGCVKDGVTLDAMSDCIFKSSSLNRVKTGPGDEAFGTGLFFGGWLQANVSSEALAGRSDSAEQAHHAASTIRIFWNAYRELRKKLSLTDDQVIEAAELKTDSLHSKVQAAVAEYGD